MQARLKRIQIVQNNQILRELDETMIHSGAIVQITCQAGYTKIFAEYSCDSPGYTQLVARKLDGSKLQGSGKAYLSTPQAFAQHWLDFNLNDTISIYLELIGSPSDFPAV